jgi:hypothetical protein
MFFEKLDTPGAVVQNVVTVAGIGEPLSHGLRRYLGLLVRMPEGFVFNRRSHNIKPYSTRAQRVMSFLALLRLA